MKSLRHQERPSTRRCQISIRDVVVVLVINTLSQAQGIVLVVALTYITPIHFR